MNYTHHPQAEGLGEIGTKAQNQRGFGMHSRLAVTPEGLALGLLTQQFFERPIGEASHTAAETQKLPIEEKESYRWIEAFQQMRSLNAKMKSLAVDPFNSGALAIHAFVNWTLAIQRIS